MDADTYLRIADKQVKDSRQFLLEQKFKLLMLAAGNVAKARELNPQQSFFDGEDMQTCDTIAASIFRAQAMSAEQEFADAQARGMERRENRDHLVAAAGAIEKLINYQPMVPANYLWLARTYRYLEDGPGMKRAVEMGLKQFPKDIDLLAFQQENDFTKRPPTGVETWAKDNPLKLALVYIWCAVPLLLLGGGWIIWSTKEPEYRTQGLLCFGIGAVLFFLYKRQLRIADGKLAVINLLNRKR